MKMVTVCSECLQSSCWQGIFLCDDSDIAATIDITLDAALAMKKEHASYIIPYAFEAEDEDLKL